MAIKANLSMAHGSAVDYQQAIIHDWFRVVLDPWHAARVWPEVHKWCVQEFGQHNYTHWGAEFFFRREADAILFALKYN